MSHIAYAPNDTKMPEHLLQLLLVLFFSLSLSHVDVLLFGNVFYVRKLNSVRIVTKYE